MKVDSQLGHRRWLVAAIGLGILAEVLIFFLKTRHRQDVARGDGAVPGAVSIRPAFDQPNSRRFVEITWYPSRVGTQATEPAGTYSNVKVGGLNPQTNSLRRGEAALRVRVYERNPPFIDMASNR